jgi:hypothetical protein
MWYVLSNHLYPDARQSLPYNIHITHYTTVAHKEHLIVQDYYMRY